MPTADEIAKHVHTVKIGDEQNGLDLLITDSDDGVTVGLFPVGKADVYDQGGAVELTPGLARSLAAELARLAG